MSQSANNPGEPGLVRLAPGVFVPEGVLEFSFSSSSGPGGQNVNKRATKCQLRVPLAALRLPVDAELRLITLAGAQITSVGELLIAADEFRSQGRNRDACIERLSELVTRAMVRPKKRRPTKPSKGSKERRLNEKKARGEVKRNRRNPD
ncbi:MAG: alternative ribosome rescue aminoacyl-tRNA hydrolase ArfB [Planctomycetota bacterium]|nr:alternative ribosome rescue aminoacyl-tRNA hydrolase ArfB [Planctomycetota bacterium]